METSVKTSIPKSPAPWLCVLAGRSGTGKSTIAQALARSTRACYLRVDAVETALARVRDDVGVEGYVVAHELAASNLLLGNDVMVDAVNALPEARAGWRGLATRTGPRLVLIETALPDAAEHRRRVENRVADIPGHRVPTWHEVQNDGWMPWDNERDGPRTVIDTTSLQSAVSLAGTHLGDA